MSEAGEFRYEDIELFKSENLGSGSYGVVCKARCNNLLCAAKIIYPILFEAGSSKSLPGSHLSPVQRFEQECEFLRQIHHPCIVQYLQTYREPDTGSSILIMELMDKNLTHFLQSSPASVPFHVRVTLCHHVALALSFLHSNGIIHRDLSSNNILINNGIRAKVTDFGMSVFLESNGSRTLCPGTLSYMPPEAINEPPVHSQKLDCFSFGCCVVQMATRIWPDPKPRFSTYLVPDPRDPSKTTEAQFAVPEVERRASHIDMMAETDSLRTIATDCLNDSYDARPSANELCARLEALKEREEFVQSLSSYESRDSNGQLADIEAQYTSQQSLLEAELVRLRSTVDQCHDDIRDKNQMLDIRARQLQKVTLSLQEKERENDRLKLRESNSLSEQNEIIESFEAEIQSKDVEIIRLKQQMDVQSETIRDQQFLLDEENYKYSNVRFDLSSKVAAVERKNTQLEQATALIAEKEKTIVSKKREIRNVEELLQTKIKSFQDTLRAKDKRIADLEEYLAASGEHLAALQKEMAKFNKLDTKDRKKVKPKPLPRFKKDGMFHMYKNDSPVPVKMHAGSMASVGNCVYFRSYGNKEILKFDSESSRWTYLVEYPEASFTLANVREKLACVGGQSSRKIRTLVESNSSENWFESYPEMNVERACASVVSTKELLLVAGGLKSDYSSLSSVELLRFESNVWSVVSALPYALHGASAALCRDKVFIGGGYYMKSRSLFSVLTCSLSALLSPQLPAAPRKVSSLPREQKLWHHTSNLPVCRASLTHHHGELLAIGGKNSEGIFSSAVFRYNELNDQWEQVTVMEQGRSNCLVASLPNKVIVAGGLCEDGIANDIEYVTF